MVTATSPKAKLDDRGFPKIGGSLSGGLHCKD